jgi:hypothetical protein
MELRAMRNRFAHEYDNDTVSMSESLNTAYSHAASLREILDGIRGFLGKYLDLTESGKTI